jgi:3-oxoadipate enol-lactonase
MGHIEIPGYGKMAYLRQGSGFPLVLLHPVGLDLTFWEYVIPLLPSGFETHALDFRGHGESDPPAAPFTLDELASDVIRYLDEMNIGKAVLCGVSMGGMVAQKVALAASGRIGGLILANTRARTEPRLMTERAEAVKAGGMSGVLKDMHKWWSGSAGGSSRTTRKPTSRRGGLWRKWTSRTVSARSAVRAW